MEIPELIDIVYSTIVNKYRKKIEKTDKCTIMTDVEKDKNILTAQLNEEQNKLLNNYVFSLEMKYDYMNFLINSLILNIGVKYGMALQKSFDEEIEEV